MAKAMPANTGKNLLSLLLMISAPEPKHTGAAFAAQRAAGLRPRRSPEQAQSACQTPPFYAAGTLLIRLPRNSAIYAFFIVYRRQYCSFILSFHASLKILVKNINWVFTFLFSHAKILSEKDLAVLRREKNGVLFS